MWKERFEEIKHELVDGPEKELLIWAADLEPVIQEFNSYLGYEPEKAISPNHYHTENGIVWDWGQVIEIPNGKRAHVGAQLKLSAIKGVKKILHRGVEIRVVSNATLLGHGILNPFKTNDFYDKVFDEIAGVRSSEEQRTKVAEGLRIKLPEALNLSIAKAHEFPKRLKKILKDRKKRRAFAPGQRLPK